MSDPGDSASTPAPPLSLEATPPVARAAKTRSGYLHALNDTSPYVAIYGVKIRAIKRWRQLGLAVKPVADMPPLDDPVAMVDWWQRVMTQDVPQNILAARTDVARPASHSPGAEVMAASPASTQKEPPAAATPRLAIANFATVEKLDLPSAIERQQQVLAVLQRDYEDGLCDPNTSEHVLTLRAGRVDKCLERLHQLEKTLTESQRKNGDLISRGELRDEVAPLLESMAGSLVSELCDRFGIDRARATVFADGWYRHLRESRFFTESVPSLTPTTAAA